MPTRLEQFQSQGLLSGNTNLWFEQIAFKDGVSHVLCYDNPVVGGIDESQSRPQILCTDEEIYNDDDFTFKHLRNKEAAEVLAYITCDFCHNELVKAWMRSGKFEDGEGIHFMKPISFAAIVDFFIETRKFSEREILDFCENMREANE